MSPARIACLLAVVASSVAGAAPAAQAAGRSIGTLGTLGSVSVNGLDRGTIRSLAFSSDGRQLYTLGGGRRARVDIFSWTAQTRTLRHLRCMAVDEVRGCQDLGPAPQDASQIIVSPDGRNVYIAGAGITTLRREQASGALTRLPAAVACLALSSPTCSDGGDRARVAAPAGSLTLMAAVGQKLLGLVRDPADGALRVLDGPDGCISTASLPGCAPADGDGWTQALAAAPDGRQLYGAGIIGTALTLAGFRVGPAGEPQALAIPSDLPLNAVPACADETLCPTPDLLFSPDGRRLVITTPGRADAGQPPLGPSHLFTREPSDGSLSELCAAAKCPQIAAPAAFAPDGTDLFATSFTITSSSGSSSAYLHALPVAAGGLPGTEDPDFGHARTSGSDEHPLRAIAASPDGRGVITSALDVLGRRTASAPALTFELPRRCVRGTRQAIVRVSGSGRKAGSALSLRAYPKRRPGTVLARGATRGAKLGVRVRARAKGPVTIEVTSIGTDDVPLVVERTLTFC